MFQGQKDSGFLLEFEQDRFICRSYLILQARDFAQSLFRLVTLEQKQKVGSGWVKQ